MDYLQGKPGKFPTDIVLTYNFLQDVLIADLILHPWNLQRMNLAAICHKTCTLRCREVLPKSTANWIRTSYPLIISQML